MGLVLKSHEVQKHDEVDVYGTPHLFRFEDVDKDGQKGRSGDSQVVVEATVNVPKDGREGIVTTGWALFRLEEVTTSLLETADIPSDERLVDFALGLAQIACGEVEPPQL